MHRDQSGEDNDGLLAGRSETSKAILVPCLLCGAFGPLCWLIGARGGPLHVAVWLSFLIVYSILQLRERVRKGARLEADRLAFRRRVLQEDETAEWFCTIVHRVWQFHEPILAQKMRAAMAEKLEAVRPSRVQAFDIQRFTLGKKAPFFKSMRLLTRSVLDLKIPEDRCVFWLILCGWVWVWGVGRDVYARATQQKRIGHLSYTLIHATARAHTHKPGSSR